MGGALAWLLPPPFRSEELRVDSTLSADDLLQRMQKEFERHIHSKSEQKLNGELMMDRFKVWSSFHLFEMDEGRILKPSVILEGVVRTSGTGTVAKGVLRPHWSSFLVAILVLLLAVFGFIFRDTGWKGLLPAIPCLILVLHAISISRHKAQRRTSFMECFNLTEIARPE